MVQALFSVLLNAQLPRLRLFPVLIGFGNYISFSVLEDRHRLVLGVLHVEGRVSQEEERDGRRQGRERDHVDRLSSLQSFEAALDNCIRAHLRLRYGQRLLGSGEPNTVELDYKLSTGFFHTKFIPSQ